MKSDFSNDFSPSENFILWWAQWRRVCKISVKNCVRNRTVTNIRLSTDSTPYAQIQCYGLTISMGH
jgi:hypothetical protein